MDGESIHFCLPGTSVCVSQKELSGRRSARSWVPGFAPGTPELEGLGVAISVELEASRDVVALREVPGGQI